MENQKINYTITLSVKDYNDLMFVAKTKEITIDELLDKIISYEAFVMVASILVKTDNSVYDFTIKNKSKLNKRISNIIIRKQEKFNKIPIEKLHITDLLKCRDAGVVSARLFRNNCADLGVDFINFDF